MSSLSRRSLVGLLMISTALASAPAMAQQTPLALGEVVVEADADGNTVVTTSAGSKLNVAITEVPQSVSVVPRERLDLQPGAKADEVLRNTAGVSTQTYGTDADTDWYYIRGFQADQNGVFLDNLSLFQTGFGTFLVDPFLLESIEVLKGPASALYGPASVGGIVNYVSKRPTFERFLYTETGVNNFGNGYLGIDGGDVLADGDFSYRLTGRLSGGGYETDGADDLRGVVQGSATWTPSDATSLTVYGSYQNVELDHTSTGFLPYVGTEVDAPGGVRIPRDFNYGEPEIDIYEREQVMIGYELEHDINGDWTVRQNARYAAVDVNEDAIYGAGDLVGELLPRYRFAQHTEAGVLTIDTQLDGQVFTGPVEHNLLFGLDYKNYNTDPETFFSFAGITPINVRDPDYSLPYTPITLTPGAETTLNQVGFYVQDQMKLDNWILTLNGRYDIANTDVESATPDSRTDNVFTGRIGLGYEFDNGLTPYVSYGTSFNPNITPAFPSGELYEAETGRQIEAGIKYEPTFMDGFITASVFDLTRDNVVGPDPSNPLNNLPVGEVNVRGAEIEAVANFDAVTLLGALTYLDAEVEQGTGDTPTGNTPTRIPTLTASLGVQYAFEGNLDGLSVGAGMRYIGESWADGANTQEIDDVTLFDANLRYETEEFALTLAASNILDESYVSGCSSLTNCGYGPGRTVSLSLSRQW
jgi:iron complex outermembrane recepter protein